MRRISFIMFLFLSSVVLCDEVNATTMPGVNSEASIVKDKIGVVEYHTRGQEISVYQSNGR